MKTQAEWIKWNGGECPVPDETLVDVKFNNGKESVSNKEGELASCWCWLNENNGHDISAYRIHDAFKDAPDWAEYLCNYKGHLAWFESKFDFHCKYKFLAKSEYSKTYLWDERGTHPIVATRSNGGDKNHSEAKMTDIKWLARNVHEWPLFSDKIEGLEIANWNGVDGHVKRVCGEFYYTKDQWLAERARLQNKPSWGDAPKWAMWLAQDEDGEWSFSTAKHREDEHGYNPGSKTGEYSNMGEVLGDWRDTLERRPDADTTPEPEEEYTGKSVSYYTVTVSKPTNPDREPYDAECNDIIEALGMSYAEGNAFKAIWRRCAARTLGKAKRGYTDGLYDAEKAHFFAGRMVEQETD